MPSWNDHVTQLPGQNLKLLGAAPFVYHCHHFNLFHDQTVEDALGPEESFQLRSRAASRASYPLIASLVQSTGAATAVERLQMASSLFAWMGQGTLEILAEATGGKARADHLHYSYAWNEKYGSKVRRHVPVDAFAAGFAAAAVEVAHGLTPGSLVGAETQCFACREPNCEITIEPGDGGEPRSDVGAEILQRFAVPEDSPKGLEHERIAAIASGLDDFLQGVANDQRGLMPGFGILVTRHLSAYYNETAYETIHWIEKNAPQATTAVEQLFGESGHVCVFYTFGNILLSPEWEALVGPVSGDFTEIVSSCIAIARALGFGYWTIQELVPNERLVLHSVCNYEHPFYLARYGQSDKPRCYVFSNAARAIMQLASRVDWASRPELTPELYQSLFKQELQWNVTETRCRARADAVCEVVVTRG